jgi:peroxiredoxin (alkyl hydroperoxide reductase subunit C)
MVSINQKVEDFSTKAFYKNKFTDIKLSDYKGKWIVLFFYPADFTFVCPTELEQLADIYEEFQKINTEILSVSTDTHFVHKAWYDNSPSIAKIKFPMLADPTQKISRQFSTLIENEGLSLRGTFLINPDGLLKAIEINDNSIGRNAEELLRKLQAAQFVHEHGDEACPAKWKPGAKTLKPSIELVGKI